MAAKESAKTHPSDAPVITYGGRIHLHGSVRAQVGWPTAAGSLEIIVELIEPGWVELHLLTGVGVEQRIRAVRQWAQAQDPARSQAAEDLFHVVNYDPRDGRLQMPPAALAFLGVFPREPEEEIEARSGTVVATPRKRRPLARYGGQQLYVQAADNSITVMSLERRNARFQALLDELPPELRG